MSNDGLIVTSVDLGVENVHLLSGEDIIGHVFHFPKDKLFRIENPVMPNIAMDPQTNNYRVGLLPLRPYLEKIKQVDVPDDNVMYHVPVGNKMGQLYLQFVSNIVVAPAGSLASILGTK